MRFAALTTARGLMLAGAAMLPAAALHAQDAGPAEEAAQAEDAIDEAGNEIIVTATKRAQTLQETPVAVSVTTVPLA